MAGVAPSATELDSKLTTTLAAAADDYASNDRAKSSSQFSEYPRANTDDDPTSNAQNPYSPFADSYIGFYFASLYQHRSGAIHHILLRTEQIVHSSITAIKHGTDFVVERGTSDFAKLVAVVQHIESHDHDYTENGRPLTSHAGAMFAMQVEPETAHRPGFGIRPAEADKAEEYDRIGEETLRAHLIHFHGDTALAMASYNAGRHRVEKTVAEHGTDWLAYMPRETQKYVANGTAMLEQPMLSSALEEPHHPTFHTSHKSPHNSKDHTTTVMATNRGLHHVTLG